MLEGGLIVLAFVLGLVLGPHPFHGVRWTFEALGIGLLACIPLVLGLVVVCRGEPPPNTIGRDLKRIASTFFAECRLLDLAVISVLAGVGEEALFRGVLQPALAGVSTPWVALGLTNIVFGIVHPVSLPYIIAATSIGIYLGILQIAFGNLLVPIVVHAAYDFAGLTYLLYVKNYRRVSSP